MLDRRLTFTAAAVLLGAAAAATASRLPVAQERAYDLEAIPSTAAARWASAGHPTLVANLWWLRTVQYVGDPLGNARGWDKLHPVVELVTDLDPRHGYAYQVAGNVLGSVGRVGESNLVLEKGIRNVPDRYILPFQRAVNAFLYAGDYAGAGRWFERAAATPGAPALRMRAYAAAMYVKGDAPDTAVALLSDLYRSAEDEESRKAIRKQLDQVRLERDALYLEAAADRYAARHGIRPVALALLVADGLVPAIPPDPFGGAYYLDPEGRVRSTASSYRFERPLSDSARRELLRGSQEQLRSMEQNLP